MKIEQYCWSVPGRASEAEFLNVHSPYDGSQIGAVECIGPEEIERALDAAHALSTDRSCWLSVSDRIEILEKAASIMATRREQLALGATGEGGKPLVDSLVEVDRAIEGVRVCGDVLRTQVGGGVPMNVSPGSAGRFALTFHEPIGPVVALSAFNHPLNLIVHQVAPAVAAGCPVIVKPAEATPLSCFRFVDILREAGLPASWCQPCVTRDLDLVGRLVADARVAFFSFIGSERVGWMLRSRLAPGTRCALEHGGAAPALVAPDASLDDAVALLARGAFYHAGQVCVSVQRIFAHRSVARELAEALASTARSMRVGDPRLPETAIGPLIRPAEVTRVREWLNEAIDGGGELIGGGAVLSPSTMEPAVLFDPPADAQVSTQEIFGPVACVYPYEDLDEAIHRANSLPVAFQASVFTRDVNIAFRASRRLAASAVMVNDHTAFRVDWMPFAGLRRSGLGTGGIPYTIREMQTEKMVVFRSDELL